MEKIKEWFYFKYGINVPVKYLWLLAILGASLLLLFFSMLFKRGMSVSNSGSGSSAPLPVNMPYGPGNVNPPIAK